MDRDIATFETIQVLVGVGEVSFYRVAVERGGRMEVGEGGAGVGS